MIYAKVERKMKRWHVYAEGLSFNKKHDYTDLPVNTIIFANVSPKVPPADKKIPSRKYILPN